MLLTDCDTLTSEELKDGYVAWRDHINRRGDTDCMLVATGPTANEASGRHFGALIVLNEATLVLPDRIVDVAVYAGLKQAQKCRDRWHQIYLSMFPTKQFGEMGGIGKHGTFVEEVRESTFQSNLKTERLGNALTTATSALCLLVRGGFKRIWCFGHDGGRGRAKGIERDIPPHAQNYNWSRKQMGRCVEVAKDSGVEVRFWPEEF